MKEALIFDIVRGSFVDGDGIRSVVFMKGCPLDCSWCHNPESKSAKAELTHNANTCIRCKYCVSVCDSNAIAFNTSFKLDIVKCSNCGGCASHCISNSLNQIGKYYSTEKLVDQLLKDREYYEISGGGVTFSGGEPLIHINYLSEVFSLLKDNHINIALQTCGHFNYSEFKEKIQPFVNTIYFDLKIMDNKEHKKHTGRDNNLILNNLNKLAKSKKHKLIVRTPLIPGGTDTEKNLNEIKAYLEKLGIRHHETLAFNPV